MKLLVDADYIVYKSCAATEYEIDYGSDVIVVASRFSDAMSMIERELDKVRLNFPFELEETQLFFSDSINFRKTLDPAYKGHRNRKKPCGYRRCINELHTLYKCVIMSELEADDALGIAATLYTGNVIVSPDKDMRQIPGQLFNMEEMMSVTAEEGRRWHLIQTLAGDQTDGYAGVPGIGVKRAEALFEKEGYAWKTVLEAFEAKGLTEDDALLNARLAKILTCDDYDFKQNKFIPWNPSPSDYGADDGAATKDETDRADSGEG